MKNLKYVIGIVALSCPSDGKKLLWIKKGINFLKKSGFKVKLGKTVFGKFGYKSADIKSRVSDLEKMFSDSEINLIMNTTGGYNANEILEFLDFELIRENQKLFVGYSDITALNLALFKKAGIATINGPMMIDYEANPECFSQFFQILGKTDLNLKNSEFIFESKNDQKIPSGEIEFLKGKKTSANGQAIVGNLSTFNLLLGTEYMPSLKNKMLFLEYDKEEQNALASLERMLWQIRQNGFFKEINGLIFGSPQKEVKKEESDDQNIKSILESVTGGFDFPVIFNAQFGHVYPSWVIGNGWKTQIDTKRPQILIIKKT